MGVLGAFLSEQQHRVMVRQDTDMTDEKDWAEGNTKKTFNVRLQKMFSTTCLMWLALMDFMEGTDDLQCRCASLIVFGFLCMKSTFS